MQPAVNPFDVRHEPAEYVVLDVRNLREIDRIAYDPADFPSRREAFRDACALADEMWADELARLAPVAAFEVTDRPEWGNAA